MVWFCKTKIQWKSFIVYIKTDDTHKDIAEDVETTIFDTSNYEWECSSIDRPLPKGKKMKK